jgi:hypothetical protein
MPGILNGCDHPDFEPPLDLVDQLSTILQGLREMYDPSGLIARLYARRMPIRYPKDYQKRVRMYEDVKIFRCRALAAIGQEDLGFKRKPVDMIVTVTLHADTIYFGNHVIERLKRLDPSLKPERVIADIEGIIRDKLGTLTHVEVPCILSPLPPGSVINVSHDMCYVRSGVSDVVFNSILTIKVTQSDPLVGKITNVAVPTVSSGCKADIISGKIDDTVEIVPRLGILNKEFSSDDPEHVHYPRFASRASARSGFTFHMLKELMAHRPAIMLQLYAVFISFYCTVFDKCDDVKDEVARDSVKDGVLSFFTHDVKFINMDSTHNALNSPGDSPTMLNCIWISMLIFTEVAYSGGISPIAVPRALLNTALQPFRMAACSICALKNNAYQALLQRSGLFDGFLQRRRQVKDIKYGAAKWGWMNPFNTPSAVLNSIPVYYPDRMLTVDEFKTFVSKISIRTPIVWMISTNSSHVFVGVDYLRGKPIFEFLQDPAFSSSAANEGFITAMNSESSADQIYAHSYVHNEAVPLKSSEYEAKQVIKKKYVRKGLLTSSVVELKAVKTIHEYSPSRGSTLIIDDVKPVPSLVYPRSYEQTSSHPIIGARSLATPF